MKKTISMLLVLCTLVSLLSGFSITASAAGQVYYKVDFSDSVMKSGIGQKITGDCPVVSVATVEAYMYGATSSSDKTTVYNAVVNKNLGTTSGKPNAEAIQNWAALGYEVKSFSLQALYDQLIQGYPVLIYSAGKEHWSVVCGYTGSTSTLQESGFKVCNVYHGGVSKQTLTAWKNGNSLTKIAIRKNGIPVTSFSGIKFAINAPEIVHKKGSGHGVYGYVVSNSNLTEVSVNVFNAVDGSSVFSKTVKPNAKSYSPYKLDSSMTFASYSAGQYYYLITAKDSAGHYEEYKKYFTISSAYPASAPTEPTYTLSYDGNGGSGSVTPTKVKFHDTFYPAANGFTRSGYTFVGWNVKRNSDSKWYVSGQGWLTQSAIDSGNYTKALYNNTTQYRFESSWLKGSTSIGDFTFYAVWERDGSAGNSFTDVPAGAYYENAVAWAVESGITAGTSDTTFSPDATCTRAQAVVFLWRFIGRPEPTTTYNPFVDVKPSDYYYKAVLWAADNGIVAGTSSTTFSPNMGCSRAQVVTFLWRFMGKPDVPASSVVFTDLEFNSYYFTPVLWAVNEGITSGTSPTTFSPIQVCTRAQIVTFLYRFAH